MRCGPVNLSKFAPNGRPLSPMTSGFTGGGVEGIGFGLAIDAHDNVWATTYGSRAIVKFDKTGKPLSPPEGYNFDGQLGLMQGIIVTPNGDVWALDVEKSQVVYMPKGDPAKGQLLFQNHTGDPRTTPATCSRPSPRDRPARPNLGLERRRRLGHPIPRVRSDQGGNLQGWLQRQRDWPSTARATSGSATVSATRRRVEPVLGHMLEAAKEGAISIPRW